MKQLFVMDEKDDTDGLPILERYAVRGILCKNGKYAMQQGKDQEYKLPGGGIEVGESFEEALCREVAEEVGLVVDKDTIQPFGEVIEVRRDRFNPEMKYIGHSFVYICSLKEEETSTNLSEHELSLGYHLVWADLETIISENKKNIKEEWRLRDTYILEEYCFYQLKG